MKKTTAFTLIELLVVIAIIAILAAILFPVFAQAKLAAKKTQSLSNIKQMGTAIIMYNGDSEDVFPITWNGAPDWGWQASWPWQLQPYMKSVEIVRDPSDNVAVLPASGPRLSYASNSIIAGRCSAWKIMLVGVMNPQFGWHGDLAGVTRSSSEITMPSSTILLAMRYRMPGSGTSKSGANSAWGAYYTGYDDFDNKDGGLPGQKNGMWGAPVGGYSGLVPDVYSGKSNFVFTDTSARSMTPAQTVNLNAPYAGGCVEANFWGMWDATRAE